MISLGGVFGLAQHGLEPYGAGGVLGELGGDDQPVFADAVLGVVALVEPAAADGHQPRIGVGEVAHRPRPFCLRLRRGPALRRGGPLPRLGQLAWARRTRQCSPAGTRGRLGSGLPVAAIDSVLRTSQSPILACWAAIARATASSASSTAAVLGGGPVRSPACWRARNRRALPSCSACA